MRRRRGPAGADGYAGAVGATYSAYMARPRLACVVERLVWGADLRPLYASLDRLRVEAPQSTIVDSACGAGLALGWLDPTANTHYIGIDSSPAMLARTARVARREGHISFELHAADAGSLPVDDAVADLCLSYNALHCLADPVGALAELRRCSRPGGLLLGSMLVRGRRARADRIMEAEAARAGSRIGPGGTSGDLCRWLRGWDQVAIFGDDAMIVFAARSPT